MPLIKVALEEGRTLEVLVQIRDSIMQCCIDVLQLPADDRNIRISEYKKGLFQTKAPYEIVVEISLFAGRSRATKKLLYQTIVERLHTNLIIVPETVFILLNEQALENWGIRGGIPADEVQLGFKVDL